MSSKGSKMIKGAAIIGAAAIIVKLMGMVMRILVNNWIGDVGMSYYGIAYGIYSALLVVSTAGIPVAISRLVSENIAVRNYRNAHRVFKVAMALMMVIGAACFVVSFFGSGLITKLQGIPEAAPALRAISPALFFAPVVATLRGYFQGRQNMNPTAISEIVEQLFRVALGLTLTHLLLASGLREAAAGATFGATCGSIAAALFLLMIYALNKRPIFYKIEKYGGEEEAVGTIIRAIITIAVPIILGSIVMPLMNILDNSIVMNRLEAGGWSHLEASTLFGRISGKCASLIAFPQIFTQAVAISLVPAIARAVKMTDIEGEKENITLGYRFSTIMAFPCAAGIFALAEPVMVLLYWQDRQSAVASAPTLMIMALGIVFLALVQTSTGVLQAVGKERIPLVSLLAAAIVKVLLSYILVALKPLNIMGAAISTDLAYIVAFVLNDRAVRKHTGARISLDLTYLRPFAASAIMGALAYLVHGLLAGIVPGSVATLIAIAFGIVVYGVLILLFKAISPAELEQIPIGRRLNRLIGKVIKNWK